VPRRLMGALAPARINPVIGRAAANVAVAHLRAKNASSANAFGGRRTNYYAGAARATSFAILNDSEVVVSVAQIGIRQRFFGGTLRPKTAKYLTIPAIAEAHGKRAREFAGLTFAVIPGKGPALVRKTAVVVVQKKTTRLSRSTSASRVGLSTTSATLRTTGGELEAVFWLRRKVTQRPDPSVLPETSALSAEINRAITSTVERAARRSGGPAPTAP